MTQAYGGQLRGFLAQGTSNRFRSFLSGMGLTMLTQSSTATILMTLSFARQSLIGLPAALALILGADLATTLVAQVLSLDVSWISPILLIIGYVTAARSERGSKGANIGHMITGVGLVLLSLTLLREAVDPLRDAPLLIEMLEGLGSEPALAVLFSAILAWILHSSLATILFYSAMAFEGIISPELGVLLVLGANIGSAFIPFLLTYQDGPIVRRITTLNLIMRSIVLLGLVPFVPLIIDISSLITDEAGRQIVNMHTGFNLVICLIYLPFVQILAKIAYKHLQNKASTGNESDIMYLDENALDKPTIALAGAARETLRMADIVETMTKQSFEAMKNHDEKLLRRARESDQKLDVLFDKIKLFLSRLKHDGLSAEETAQVRRILAFATNLEHCGDLIENSLTDLVEKKIASKESFSPEGWEEIRTFYEAVIENMHTAQSVFISQSTKLAGELIEAKKHLKQVEFESRRKHFNRLSEKQPQSLATSSIHIDLVRDLGRLNSYMTAIAYETMNS
jgi:phosphate:Na+ symporter